MQAVRADRQTQFNTLSMLGESYAARVWLCACKGTYPQEKTLFVLKETHPDYKKDPWIIRGFENEKNLLQKKLKFRHICALADVPLPPASDRIYLRYYPYSLTDLLYPDRVLCTDPAHEKLLNKLPAMKAVQLTKDARHPDLYNKPVNPLAGIHEKVITPASMDGATINRLMHELMTAVAYLHYMDMVHRDIKPNNIMLDQNGTLVLCDFAGCAKARDEVSIVHTTLGYLSPELLRLVITSKADCPAEMKYQASPEDDSWAVGVTCLQLLRRRQHPFMETINMSAADIRSRKYHSMGACQIERAVEERLDAIQSHERLARPLLNTALGYTAFGVALTDNHKDLLLRLLLKGAATQRQPLKTLLYHPALVDRAKACKAEPVVRMSSAPVGIPTRNTGASKHQGSDSEPSYTS